MQIRILAHIFFVEKIVVVMLKAKIIDFVIVIKEITFYFQRVIITMMALI